jgi:hypothetical protein
VPRSAGMLCADAAGGPAEGASTENRRSVATERLAPSKPAPRLAPARDTANRDGIRVIDLRSSLAVISMA